MEEWTRTVIMDPDLVERAWDLLGVIAPQARVTFTPEGELICGYWKLTLLCNRQVREEGWDRLIDANKFDCIVYAPADDDEADALLRRVVHHWTSLAY